MSSQRHGNDGLLSRKNTLNIAFGASFCIALTTLAWNASVFAPISSLSILLNNVLSFPSRIVHAWEDQKIHIDLDLQNATYTLKDSFIGDTFLKHFIFEAIPDPTHGRVNYVDKEYALLNGLVSSSNDSFLMRADATKTLSGGGKGRDSVRIRSREAYETHLAVFDIRHMPQGCGTWPALWQTSEHDWPTYGEVDILEGVNDQSPNAMTLHTTAGCTMPAKRNMSGRTLSTDCDWLANFNTGCGVASPRLESYGPLFNAAGGGWYVVERSTSYIRIFFWSRGDNDVPLSVKLGADRIDTSGWGIPSAFFPDSHCNLRDHFGPNHIIINLTFCGDWAGQSDVYRASGCPSTCVDYVDNNPEAFQNAFWDVASIRVYT